MGSLVPGAIERRLAKKFGKGGATARQSRLDGPDGGAGLASHLVDGEVDQVVEDNRAALCLGKLLEGRHQGDRVW
jgi:hypothetical protein